MWQTLFSFILPVSTKEKSCRHKNFLLQHGFISKLVTLKAEAQYLFQKFQKKFRFEETLNKVLRNANTKIRRSQCNNINTKQNRFYINSIFCFQKLILRFKKLSYIDFYLLNGSIEGTIWLVLQMVSRPHIPPSSLRCAPALTQFTIWLVLM